MGKVYKGYELMKLIAEKKIKEGTRFRNKMESPMYDNRNIYVYKNNNFIGRYGGVNLIALMDNDFEILDEEQEIDNVNAYKLMEAPYMAECLRNDNFDKFMELLKQSELEVVEKLNNVIGKINQLDNKIKEK